MKKNVLRGMICLGFLLFSYSSSQASWCSNMTSNNVWHLDGVEVSVGVEPWFSWRFSKIVCCVQSTDMNACNQSVEDTSCAQIVTRPPCVPIPE